MQTLAVLQFALGVFLLGSGLFGPTCADAETREEWLDRRNQEAQARKQAREQGRYERRAQAASQPSPAEVKRAEREARMEETRKRREASAAASRSGTSPPNAKPAPPAVVAPVIPGQPSAAELIALVQKNVDTRFNNENRAMVDRCNAGKPKDRDEQAYCQGWFAMEKARRGDPGRMRYDDVTVTSLTIRACTLRTTDYHCIYDIKFNVEKMLVLPVNYMLVRRQGTRWEWLDGTY